MEATGSVIVPGAPGSPGVGPPATGNPGVAGIPGAVPPGPGMQGIPELPGILGAFLQGPSIPGGLGAPGGPRVPGDQGVPGDLGVPRDPGVPRGLRVPGAPGRLVSPGAPADPGGLGGPGAPGDQGVPGEPRATGDPEVPGDPVPGTGTGDPRADGGPIAVALGTGIHGPGVTAGDLDITGPGAARDLTDLGTDPLGDDRVLTGAHIENLLLTVDPLHLDAPDTVGHTQGVDPGADLQSESDIPGEGPDHPLQGDVIDTAVIGGTVGSPGRLVLHLELPRWRRARGRRERAAPQALMPHQIQRSQLSSQRGNCRL